MINDLVVDTLYEEVLISVVSTLGGRVLMDKDDPEEPYLTPDDGYLIVRVKDKDPVVYSRELERRVSNMRVVTVVDRTPKPIT